MYRPSTHKPGPGPPPPPPYGPPPPYAPLFGLRGPCTVPPPGYLPPAVSAPAPDSLYLYNKPPPADFMSPNSSSFSTADPTPTPATQWKPTPFKHLPSDSDRAGEEFLRCIAANKPLPDYLKGNMAYNLAEAFKSANALKEAVKSDPEFQKHVTKSRSHSRSRSRGRSRGKSRGRSPAKPHTQSKSRGRSPAKPHAQSKSRGRSPDESPARSKSPEHRRSRERSKNRAHAKGRVRSKSRARSRSRNRSRSQSHSKSKKNHVRSKSRVRRSKSRSKSREKSHGKDRKRKRSPSPSPTPTPSPSPSPSHSHSPSHSNKSNSSRSSRSSCPGSNILQARSSLLEGLKLVMNSKDLEDRLPSLKDALLTIQATDENKKSKCVQEEHRHQQYGSLEGSASLENESMLLPHDRVGSDFSWLQGHSQPYSPSKSTAELEDEESFLYGVEDPTSKPVTQTSTALFPAFSQTGEHSRLQEKDSHTLGSQQHHQSVFSDVRDQAIQKQPQQTSSSSSDSANQDSSECEKIKYILKSLGTANITEIVGKMQRQKKEKPLPSPLVSDPTPALPALPALSSPNVRQALESLQSLIKATKEKRTKKDSEGTPQTSDTHKAGDLEESKREKQAHRTKMESLMKELEELLKLQGLRFLTPVLGFYCQKCEEFIGDLNSAESHSAIHNHGNLTNQKSQANLQTGDHKGHSSSNQPPPSSDKRDPRNYSSNKDCGDHTHQKDYRSKPETLSFQEELKKERLLITVSCGQTPPKSVRDKEEGGQEQANGSHSDDRKVEHPESKKKTTKHKRSRDKSSDSSDGGKRKEGKEKSPKKKKKDKKKKKKKDRY